MFPNLELEMFKRKVTSKELAQTCGISECAMRNKRMGRTEFTLEEIENILAVFSGCEWSYLFARENEKGKAG